MLAAVVVSQLSAQKTSKTEILSGIESGCDYMQKTMLDKEGKSRCDYNMMQSAWEPYEVAWHTGQAINALLDGYLITNNKKYLNKAIQAGNWWISLEIKDHPKLNGMIKSTHGAEMGETIVYSTTTDGSAGLFKLWRVTGNKKYAQVATNAGKWLYENNFEPVSGLSYDCIDPVTGEVQKNWSLFWPDRKIQSLNDVARPNAEGSLFLDMSRFTGDEKFKQWFINQYDVMVRTQSENGLWMRFTPNDTTNMSIHPRFNLWYAEALMDGYEITGDKKYLEAALKTARYHQQMQQKNGTIYYRNYADGKNPDIESVTGSAVSFSGILWLRLLKAGAGKEFEKSIEKSIQWVLLNRFSVNHPDPNLRGAFIDSRLKDRKTGIWMVNRDIGTIFGVRFLSDYYNYYYKK